MASNIDFTQTILFQEGKEEGLLEANLKTARKMLEKGYTALQAEEMTDLTSEQIQRLQEKLKGMLKVNLETAKKMLEKGYSISQAQEITKLPFEQIQKLQDDINAKILQESISKIHF